MTRTIGATADFRWSDFAFLRAQSRYSGKLTPSRAPFKRSRLRNLIGAIVGVLTS